mgnify:CR=1 FL=1
MASTNKTTNLNLNSWTGSDKPKREDFVNDNNIIDNKLGSHLLNEDIHITNTLKQKITNPFICSTYYGNGNESQTITLAFEPTLVIVFAQDKPLCEFDETNDYTINNSAMAAFNSAGESSGIYLNGTTITMSQSQTAPSNGIYNNLNNANLTYTYIAFK